MEKETEIQVIEESQKATEEPVVEVAKEKTPEELEKEAKELKRLNVIFSSRIFKGGIKVQGKSKVGVTKKNKKLSKKSETMAKNSRKKNKKISEKKFRPTGSKKRK